MCSDGASELEESVAWWDAEVLRGQLEAWRMRVNLGLVSGLGDLVARHAHGRSHPESEWQNLRDFHRYHLDGLVVLYRALLDLKEASMSRNDQELPL